MKQIEQQKILSVFSNGEKMLNYYKAIGMKNLSDFAGADAGEIAMRIDIHLGGKHINSLGVHAIQNVIDRAEREGKKETNYVMEYRKL